MTLTATSVVAPRQARGAVLFALTVLWCVGISQSAAHAQLTLSGDGEVAIANSVSDIGTGGSFGIRLGTELRGETFFISPEFGFNYTGFTTTNRQKHPPEVYRGILGVRLGIGQIVRVGVMAHFGFGYTDWARHYYDNKYVEAARIVDGVVRDEQGREKSGYQDLSTFGFTYDAGVFLEFCPTETTNLGLHLAYARMSDNDTPWQQDPLDWIQIGLHGGFEL